MRHHDDHLLQIPLFAGLTTKELEHIHHVITEIDVPAGTVLMEEGTTGHEMVIVLSGALEVRRHGEHIADIGAGGFAGEMAILAHRLRRSSVVTTVDSRLLHIDGRGFNAVLHDVPQLAVKMLPIVASRVSPEHD